MIFTCFPDSSKTKPSQSILGISLSMRILRLLNIYLNVLISDTSRTRERRNVQRMGATLLKYKALLLGLETCSPDRGSPGAGMYLRGGALVRRGFDSEPAGRRGFPRVLAQAMGSFLWA